MKKIFIFTVLLFTGLLAYGQFDESLHTLQLSPLKIRNNYRAVRTFNTGIKEILKGDYRVVNNSSIIIKAKVKSGVTSMIEGMETMVVAKPTLKIRILDQTTKKDSVFAYAKKITADVSNNLEGRLIDSFFNDATAQNEFKQFLKAFLNDIYANNCSTQIAAVEKMKSQKQLRKALILLANITAEAPCNEKALQLEKEIIDSQALETCANKLQKAEIIINSGVSFQYPKALNILLSIPPDAPCAEKALQLSKVMGNNLKNNPKMSSDLSNYQQLYSGGRNNWRLFYLERLLR